MIGNQSQKGLGSFLLKVGAGETANAQPGSPHGRCAIKPRSAGDFYVSRHMNGLRLRLMHREALQRLRDADTLSEAMGLVEQSDSPYLLRLLALELLLKVVFESVLQKPAHGHQYENLFNELPSDRQATLLSLAGERVGPSALAANHVAVFKEWGQNFVALRYPWERYKALSEEQYANLGNEWAAKGAPLEEATFRYYPQELLGVLTALQAMAAELSGASHNGG